MNTLYVKLNFKHVLLYNFFQNRPQFPSYRILCLCLSDQIHFCELNSNVLKSCTEILQQFHKPKKAHKGSPVKARNLKGSLKAKNDDDPRHPQDRDRQRNLDEMRNKLIAYTFYSGRNLANCFSFDKANFVQASQDHDYLRSLYPEDQVKKN